jgi:Tol biopolymer transport system component
LLPVTRGGSVEIAGQEGDNVDPAFSPDGQQLAFASTRAVK